MTTNPMPKGGPDRCRALSGKPPPPKLDLKRPILRVEPESDLPRKIALAVVFAIALGALAYQTFGQATDTNSADQGITAPDQTASLNFPDP